MPLLIQYLFSVESPFNLSTQRDTTITNLNDNLETKSKIQSSCNREEGNSIATVFGLLFLAVGILFIFGSLGAYKRDTDILNNGLRASAQVLALDSVTPADGDADHFVKYAFTGQDGVTYKNERIIGKTVWDKLVVGETIEIAYQANNPDKNFPVTGGGVTSLVLVFIMSIFGLGMSAFGLALVWAVVERQILHFKRC